MEQRFKFRKNFQFFVLRVLSTMNNNLEVSRDQKTVCMSTRRNCLFEDLIGVSASARVNLADGKHVEEPCKKYLPED